MASESAGIYDGMVPKLLSRWYGVDHWPETYATVVSREELFRHKYEEGGPSASAKLSFYYQDTSGSIQSGQFRIDDESPLYGLNKNDSFRIQFNPQRPSQYFCRYASTFYSEVPFLFWSLFGLVLLCGLIIWFIRSSGCS